MKKQTDQIICEFINFRLTCNEKQSHYPWPARPFFFGAIRSLATTIDATPKEDLMNHLSHQDTQRSPDEGKPRPTPAHTCRVEPAEKRRRQKDAGGPQARRQATVLPLSQTGLNGHVRSHGFRGLQALLGDPHDLGRGQDFLWFLRLPLVT